MFPDTGRTGSIILRLLEEAKERDHRKIGKDMNLFMVDDLVGRGLTDVLTKGLYDLAGT